MTNLSPLLLDVLHSHFYIVIFVDKCACFGMAEIFADKLDVILLTRLFAQTETVDITRGTPYLLRSTY